MKISLIDVPAVRRIAIDGTGKPAGVEFQGAVSALYSVAYTLRFALKAEGIDEKVSHLEGTWDRDMNWTLFIRVPDVVDQARFDGAVTKVRGKRDLPALKYLRLETWEEGPAVEALHTGPYANEPQTVAAMDAFMEQHGLRMVGPHHEIYLSDPSRTKPEKLRTILRHPVAAV